MEQRKSLTRPGVVGETVVLIYEEAFLWEITIGMTEHVSQGRTFEHAERPAGICRELLLRWFDAGWLDCIAWTQFTFQADWVSRAARDGDFYTLDRADARALLDNPALWLDEGPAAGVSLCRTDATDGFGFSNWARAVADIATDPAAPGWSTPRFRANVIAGRNNIRTTPSS
jgi:hypothetical protein